MNSTLGYGFVLLGLLLCAVGAPVGFAAGLRRSPQGLLLTRRISLAFAATMIAASGIMWYALIKHDFSVGYVAQVGSTETPLHITIVSFWSSLEGSILFWVLVLGLYIAAVAVLQRRGHEDYLAYTLATLLSVALYFCVLIAGPANPFSPFEVPPDFTGPGPNPLLQNHLLMIVHPPTLYLGYVGMTVPFAMAVAALLRGKLGATWLLPLRNWLLVPTAFLTLGIMLGGWWSYEVLGWGGYWAWDPVENASFLPWLTAIAAVHSAVVQQRRGTLKAWTTILVLMSFLLTILGTFLTRSGVVNSVHAFSQGQIGPYFLAFLTICLIAVVVLLALRIDTLSADPGAPRGGSREGAFLFNNLILVGIMFTVLVGTLYPIAAESIRGVKVSVGEPYFNRMSVPLFLGLILLMGIGPAMPWGRATPALMRRALLRPLPAAAAGAAIAFAFGAREGYVLASCALAGYTLWVTTDQGLRPTRARAARGENYPEALANATRIAPRRLGGFVVHFGVLMTFVAIAISANYQTDNERMLAPGESFAVHDYEVRFDRTYRSSEPHLERQIAEVTVFKNGRELGKLGPSLNFYRTRREPLATPKVRTSLSHDLYLTLMSVDRSGQVGIRAIVTPAVLWIWVGVFIMFFGTVLCLIPPRVVASKVARETEVALGAATSKG
ncbi:MAG: heme lyase CcmF/NrfE family subunit [Acidobacteriota bacterium]